MKKKYIILLALCLFLVIAVTIYAVTYFQKNYFTEFDGGEYTIPLPGLCKIRTRGDRVQVYETRKSVEEVHAHFQALFNGRQKMQYSDGQKTGYLFPEKGQGMIFWYGDVSQLPNGKTLFSFYDYWAVDWTPAEE